MMIKSPSTKSKQPPKGLTHYEASRIELFYKSLRADVIVCKSIAKLYKSVDGEWKASTVGIPAVTWSTDTLSNERRINLIVADAESGFTVWKDTLDRFSFWHKTGDYFHTFCLSGDRRQLAGINYLDSDAAEEFFDSVLAVLQRYDNTGFAMVSDTRLTSKKRATSKRDISQPCQFNHVTHLCHHSESDVLYSGFSGRPIHVPPPAPKTDTPAEVKSRRRGKYISLRKLRVKSLNDLEYYRRDESPSSFYIAYPEP